MPEIILSTKTFREGLDHERTQSEELGEGDYPTLYFHLSN